MRIGEKVEARAKELRIGPTELARKIKSTKQNVYNIFQRDSIDTDLLLRLSKALSYDFFEHYRSPLMTNEARPPYGKPKKGRVVITADTELAQLKKDYQMLREKYELLKELYEAKTGKKVPGTF
jgi:hypothetical protein